MSWVRPLLNTYLRLTEKRHLSRATGPDVLRQSLRRKARLFFHPPFGTAMARRALGSGEALWVTPRQIRQDTILLYFHGGGYVFGAPETHAAMVANLAKRVGGRAILPQYPLAPEHPYPAAANFAEGAYRAVLAEHPAERIFLGGDSAGGGLALTLLARILHSGMPPPRGLFAFSPLTDLAFTGPSFVANADADVELPADRAQDMADLFLAGADPTAPDVSPLYADFSGAPPMWITVGDTEILRDDSRRLATRVEVQGVDATFVEERDLPHVWPIFHNLLPEARATLQALAEWIDVQAASN